MEPIGIGIGIVAGAVITAVIVRVTRPAPEPRRKGKIEAPQGSDGIYRWRGVVGGEVVANQPLRGKGKGFTTEDAALREGCGVLFGVEWEEPTPEQLGGHYATLSAKRRAGH